MPHDESYPEDPESPLFYDDRTGITTDWACGMKYWWSRKEGGIGITPIHEAAYYLQGRETHEDLSAVADMEDISSQALQGACESLISSRAGTGSDQSQASMETFSRRLGWLSAFTLYIEPGIRAEYDTIKTEDELILDRSPLWVAVTPDRLLRHRADKYLVYKEYKSTITAGQKWASHWPYAIQTHIGMKAIEEHYNEKVAFTQIVGLLKGSSYSGRLSHPYVWAYRRGNEWTEDYSKARSAGWDHAPVWEYPGGIVEWVERLGKDVALSQFPHSAPIFLNNRLLENLIKRRIIRAIEVANVAEECQTNLDKRNLHFEQRFEECRPAFGDPCPFLAACHNASVNANPLGSGLYKVRVPHHQIEIEYLRGE